MTNKNSIADAVEKLEHSPTYAMSLGSKELFHSNFWAWLFENEKILKGNYLDIFFQGTSHQNARIKREEKNRDISIHIDDKLYVIENKLKSFLSSEQLVKYSNSDNITEGCFTGMNNPFPNEDDQRFGKNKTKWKFISYKTIGEEIAKQAENEPDDITRTIIKSYASDIILLNKIIAPIEKETKGRYIVRLKKETQESLSKIRMEDIILKLNASEFKKYAKTEYKLEPEISFNNKKSTITFRDYRFNDKVSAGIQIEGNQYRRFLEINNESSDKCAKLFKIAIGCGWLDETIDYNSSNRKKMVLNKQTSMNPRKHASDSENSKKYNQYKKPNPFVYQYWDIDKNLETDNSEFAHSISFEELMECVKQDLKNLPREILSKRLEQDKDLNIKVGILAKGELRRLLESGAASAQEIESFQTLEASKKEFKLHFPLLVQIDASFQHNRYYTEPLSIGGKQYKMTSQWTEDQRKPLEAWIKKHENNN